MLARSSLVTARAALRQAPANPAMRRGLHVDSQFLVCSRLIRFISLNRDAFRACADPSRRFSRRHQQHDPLRYAARLVPSPAMTSPGALSRFSISTDLLTRRCTLVPPDQTNGAKLGFYMVSFFGFGFAAPFLASAFQMCVPSLPIHYSRARTDESSVVSVVNQLEGFRLKESGPFRIFF